MKEYERVEITSRDAWRGWLQEHHAQRHSIWLVTWKKTAGERHVPYDAIVEEALAFGWVDSLPRKLDEKRTMLLLSPRKPGSGWSRINKERVAKLIAAGRMTPAGQAKVDAARADGSWAKLDRVETLALPDDLQAALHETRDAERNFTAFPPSAKRGILEWIGNAKRAETRAKRIAQTVREAALNRRANQPRQPKGSR